MIKERYLENIIEDVCFSSRKMAFISGARQCGKTTLAKQVLKQRKVGHYYNWDEIKFRRLWTKDPSNIIPSPPEGHTTPLIILDELHKAKSWKKNLKGVFDTLEIPCDILVTGSARLNIYRKGSDSLLGRYYHLRLHPFSLCELTRKKHEIAAEDLLDAIFNRSIKVTKQAKEYMPLLMRFGPFPEPLLAGTEKTLNLWRRNRVEKIIREDLRDLSRLPELSQVEMLTSLLPERVANPLSIKSLSEDVEVAYTTVKRWLHYLNELYYFFEVKPYSKSLSRSIKKEGKLYLWDWSEVENEASRFENLVAMHLLKYCDYLTDSGMGNFELRYLRNKEKKEIDFLLLKNNKPWLPIEVKLNQGKLSDNWKVFLPQIKCPQAIQIVNKPGVFKIVEQGDYKILTVSAEELLCYLI
jgi:uncharacterized protein